MPGMLSISAVYPTIGSRLDSTQAQHNPVLSSPRDTRVVNSFW